MIKNKLFVLLLFCSFGFSSCEDFFRIEKEDFLTDKDNYKERNQIYSGMVGLATNFRDVMDDYIILSELRGDLLEPTETAPDEYWDIFRYKSDANNSAASPAPLYQLISNCNDFLRNLRNYYKTYPGAIEAVTYRGMVASTLTYRAWAYMNIGKLYGKAYYHDLSVSDMNQDMSQGTLLDLKPLLGQLISSLQNGIDGINAFHYLDWRLIVMDPTIEESVFDATWTRIVVNPDILLTELYLWDGNHINAAKQGILALKGEGLYKAGTNTKLFNLKSYSKNNKTDPYWTDGAWWEIFGKDLSTNHLNEAMTAIQFDHSKRQTHDLQYYFSNYAPNIYRFRPTALVSDGIFGGSSSMFESLPLYFVPKKVVYVEEEDLEAGQDSVIDYVQLDFDGYRAMGTVGRENGANVVAKYSMDRKAYEHDATIYVYRAAELVLMVAEALNGIGVDGNRAADSLVSVGLASSWDGTNKIYKAPFDTPIYSGSHLSSMKGILGRLQYTGNFTNYYIPKYHKLSESEFIARKQFVMDSIIAQETARELAYEGKRWFTLVRMALNSNMPEKVSNVVINKFPLASRDQYRVWLTDPSNWFIKWDHTPKAVNP